jgi:hypothetical protein
MQEISDQDTKQNSTFKSLLSSAAIAFAVTCAVPAAALEQIPLRDFFKNPEQDNFQLSQQGVYLSYLKPWNNRMNVFVQKISDERLPVGEPKQVTFVTDRDVLFYSWKGDNTVLYLKDSGGDENFHVYAVDVSSTKERDLTQFPNTRAHVDNNLKDISETDILISSNQRNAEMFDIYRVNVETGVAKMVAKNPGSYVSWLSDHNGAIRVAVEHDGLFVKIYSRANEDSEFKQILQFHHTTDVDPLIFTPDNKYFYAASNLGRDKQAIVVIDPEDGREIELLFEHPEVDVTMINYSHYLKKITAASFVTWKQNFHFFEKAIEERHERVKAKVGDKQIFFTTTNHVADLFTLKVTDDKTRDVNYL